MKGQECKLHSVFMAVFKSKLETLLHRTCHHSISARLLIALLLHESCVPYPLASCLTCIMDLHAGQSAAHVLTTTQVLQFLARCEIICFGQPGALPGFSLNSQQKASSFLFCSLKSSATGMQD